MKSTAISIIKDALIGIGEYMEADIIHDDDAERSLHVLNDMMDEWSNQELACFSFKTQSILLVNNKADYTIGPVTVGYPTPDIISERPLKLEQVYLQTQDHRSVRFFVNIDTLYDFNLLTARQATSTLPTDVYYDSQDPIATIKVWPIPINPTNYMYWTSYSQLSQFDNLADEYEFPKGYRSALKNNLMVAMCPYFGKAVPPDVRLRANESVAWIKRTNTIFQPAKYDSAITTQYRGGFNVWTGVFVNRGP